MPFVNPIPRGLILVAQPEYMATGDLILIRDKIVRQAPDLSVLIVGRNDRAELIDPAFWRRPVLTVSFGPLGKFSPRRGAVLQNRAIPKLEQYIEMNKAGVRTPKTARFHFGMDLSDGAWGKFCILKPASLDSTSSGQGLYLYRTERLGRLSPSDLPIGHMARREPMIVQSFIDTGPKFQVFRCLTLFGERIYQNRTEAPEEHPPLDLDDKLIESMVPEPPRSRSTPQVDEDTGVMEFAQRIAGAFKDIPLLGCDIIRHHASGELYALEVNAGGNVWHLSSPRTQGSRTITKIQAYLRTFNSYDSAASALIREARRSAS